MTRRSSVFRTTLGLLLLSALPASAVPGLEGAPPITIPEGAGDILADHDKPTALFAAPANRRQVNGTYARLASASCDNFVSMHGQTFRFPPDIDGALAANQFVSNYFQIAVGLPQRNKSVTDEILRLRQELRARQRELELLTPSELVLSDWAELERQLTELDARDRALESLPAAGVLNCVSNPATMTACMQDLVAEQARQRAEVAQQTEQVLARQAELRAAYQQALQVQAELATLQEMIRDIQADLAFWELIRSSQASTSQAAFDLERSVLTTEEKKVVGRASVGYSLFDREVALVRSALNAAGYTRHTVTQLPVFNVRLNLGSRVANPVLASSDDPAALFPYALGFEEGSLIGGAARQATALTLQAATDGSAPGRQLVYTLPGSNAFASGGFDMYVTQGARCGDVEQIQRSYQAPGDDHAQTFATPTFRAHADGPVFAQSVGLTYNFYAYPGPMKGECEIEVDKMNDYWRDAGRTKKWRWFRTYTTTWDNTRQEMRDSLGLTCKLDMNPQSSDPIEAASIAQAMEQQMYDEMWKLFLTVYAKSYEIKTDQAPEVIDPGRSTVGATLGGGLMSICGANIYCQIGNVVLKTLDELGGSRAQGTTSSVSHIYGKIRKTFDKDTFLVREGASVIDLQVCIDPQRCS